MALARLKDGSSRGAAPGVDEAVAGARLREQVARPGRVELDLAPELGDVDVEVVGLGLVRGAPDLAKNRPVREQLAFVDREQTKQRELVRRELEELAVPVDSALLEVDSQLADRHYRLARRSRAPQCRAQAGE